MWDIFFAQSVHSRMKIGVSVNVVGKVFSTNWSSEGIKYEEETRPL
jgi:hypothetical protein